MFVMLFYFCFDFRFHGFNVSHLGMRGAFLTILSGLLTLSLSAAEDGLSKLLVD